MLQALLLSPDDQAVSAITGVLEEMSVTCERPLDGVSAAQKLNSHNFDLVLVDCENLPAAKLIFDVCRHGKGGNNPVPIAIVDGRAGLPTAFRLGAELILTKPVAKDQARTTIRTAVNRVRKNVPGSESAPAAANAAASSEAISSALPGSHVLEEKHASAAAAGAAATSLSQLTSYADPAPGFAPVAVRGAASTETSAAPQPALAAIASASNTTTKMSSAVEEIETPPATHPPEPHPTSSPVLAAAVASPARTVSSDSKAADLPIPSDDPVLAELERTEQEEAAAAKSQAAETQKPATGLKKEDLAKALSEKVTPDKATSEKAASQSVAAVSSHPQARQKPRAALVALLVLAVAGAGFYLAWMYQPGFQELVRPQIDRVLTLVGMPPLARPSKLVKAPARVVPAKAAATAPASPTALNILPQTTPSANTPLNSTAASPATPVSAPPAAAGTTALPPSEGRTSGIPASTASASGAGNSAAAKPNNKAGDISPNASGDLASTPLPGENSAVILSSKGAEKRLAYSVAPKVPAPARSSDGEGTVVLKAVVDESGKVAGLRLVEGNAALANAAILAVKQWRYRPYVRDGKAQAFQTVVIVDFQRP